MTPEPRPARFIVERGGKVLAAVTLDAPDRPCIAAIETDVIGFQLVDAPADARFCVVVGDVPEDGTPELAGAVAGERSGDHMYWDEDAMLDGHAGIVAVRLFSSTLADEWTARAVLDVDVANVKLGGERIAAMRAELAAFRRRAAPADMRVQTDRRDRDGRADSTPSRYRAHDLPRILSVWRDARAAVVDAAAAGPRARVVARLTLAHVRRALRQARSDARAGIEQIERDRAFRSLHGSRADLFTREDAPRLSHLRALDAAACAALRDVALRACRLVRIRAPAHRPGSAPRQPRGASHSDARITRTLGRARALLRRSTPDSGGPTARVYERWVFLQIVRALRLAGLDGGPGDAHVDGIPVIWHFALDAGHHVRVRYEAWIHPPAIARVHDELIRRSDASDRSLRPDVLIELIRSHRGSEDLRAAIVVDAKYTLHVDRHHWSAVGRYALAGTRDADSVVAQIWIAAPLEDGLVHRIVASTMAPPQTTSEQRFPPTVFGTVALRPPRAFTGPATPPGATALAFAHAVIGALREVAAS